MIHLQSHPRVLFDALVGILHVLNFEVWMASSSFRESFSTERELKVLIKKDISF